MKKTIIAILLFCVFSTALSAQVDGDLKRIYLQDGSTMNAYVEKTDGGYKLTTENGDVFEFRESEIRRIGMPEMGQPKSSKVTNNYGGIYSQKTPGLYAVSVDELRPNMKYKDLKLIYSTSSWDGRMAGDPYNSASWCWNFLLTGLGQMTMGEVGRGAAFLGAQAGCMALTGLGCFLWDYTDAEITGIIMMYAAPVGMIITKIISMVDAANVMKIKNMYARDMRNFASNVEFNLSPWVCPSPIPNGNYTTAAGLSLTMRF